MRQLSDNNIFVDNLGDAWKRPHNIATLIEVYNLSGLNLLGSVPIIGGEVTLDSRAESWGSASFEVKNDGTYTPRHASDLLTPFGNEVKIYRGIAYPDRNELVKLGIFRIESVDVGSNGELSISALDRSAAIIEASFEGAYQSASGALATDVIREIVLQVVPDTQFNFATTSIVLPQSSAQEDDSRWEAVQDIAFSLGADLFYDRDGVLVLRPTSLAFGSPDYEFQEGQGGVLVDVSKIWDRGESGNRAIITGESSDVATPVRGVATDDNPLSPTYYSGKFGHKPVFWSSDLITTQTQADDAAYGYLNSVLGVAESVSFGTFVNPSTDPGDVALITRELTGVNENHVIDNVTIPLSSEDSMTGDTRVVQVTT